MRISLQPALEFSVRTIEFEGTLDLLDGCCTCCVGIDVFKEIGVQLEALPDLGGHLSVELEFILAQAVVLQRKVVLLLVVTIGVEHHRARVSGEVAFDLVSDPIRLNILAQVEELDVGGLHGVDCLYPGPFTKVRLVIGLVPF